MACISCNSMTLGMSAPGTRAGSRTRLSHTTKARRKAVWAGAAPPDPDYRRSAEDVVQALGGEDALGPVQQGLGVGRLDTAAGVVRDISEFEAQQTQQDQGLALSHTALLAFLTALLGGTAGGRWSWTESRAGRGWRPRPACFFGGRDVAQLGGRVASPSPDSGIPAGMTGIAPLSSPFGLGMVRLWSGGSRQGPGVQDHMAISAIPPPGCRR